MLKQNWDHKDKERKKLVDKLKKVDWEEIYKIIQDQFPKILKKYVFKKNRNFTKI